MIHLIVGRTASGKDYLANLLKEKYGKKLVISRTTRPKRYEDEDTHIFVTEEEALKDKDKYLAYTEINNYKYYVTKEDIESKNVYIIDPNGLDGLIEAMPDTVFNIHYVEADKMMRKAHYEKRQSSGDFEQRNKAEDEQFTAFEEKLHKIIADNDMSAFPLNVRSVAIHKNDYDPDYFLNIAADIASIDNAVEQMKDIVYEAICEKILNEKDGKILIVSQKDGVVPVSVDIFTNVLLYGTDSEGFRRIITELWHTKFNKKSNL